MGAGNHRLRIGAIATAQYSGDGDPSGFVEHRPIAAKRPIRRGDRLS